MYNPLKPSKKLKARPLDSRTADAQKKTAMQQQNQKSPRDLLNNIQDAQGKLGFKTGDVLLKFVHLNLPQEVNNPEDMDLAITEFGIAAHAWNLLVASKVSDKEMPSPPAIPFFKHTKDMVTSTRFLYYKSRFEQNFSHYNFLVLDCADFSWQPKTGYNVDLMCVVIE